MIVPCELRVGVSKFMAEPAEPMAQALRSVGKKRNTEAYASVSPELQRRARVHACRRHGRVSCLSRQGAHLGEAGSAAPAHMTHDA